MSVISYASIERAALAIKEPGACEVYIFGSAATHTMRPDSDVDFAVSGLPAAFFFVPWAKPVMPWDANWT